MRNTQRHPNRQVRRSSRQAGTLLYGGACSDCCAYPVGWRQLTWHTLAGSLYVLGTTPFPIVQTAEGFGDVQVQTVLLRGCAFVPSPTESTCSGSRKCSMRMFGLVFPDEMCMVVINSKGSDILASVQAWNFYDCKSGLLVMGAELGPWPHAQYRYSNCLP